MLLLSEVLSPEDVSRIRDELDAAPFRQGRATAGSAARRVKHNSQAHGDDPAVQALGRFVRSALERHPAFTRLARPARWSRVLFSRYGEGDRYGRHTDDAMMRCEAGMPMRSDLSFTLFLSAPAAYEGGALTLDGLDGAHGFRPPAGSAVLYQTGQTHQVEPVTRGERLAAVGWVQSLVRRQDQREVLFDLEQVRAAMTQGEERLLIDKTLGALLRQWAEP